MDTVRQTCERRDNVGCSGEPVVSSEYEKQLNEPGEEKLQKRKRDDSVDSVVREYVGLVLSVVGG